jgi:hypothetical protein
MPFLITVRLGAGEFMMPTDTNDFIFSFRSRSFPDGGTKKPTSLHWPVDVIVQLSDYAFVPSNFKASPARLE